ncbi:MAG TPA: glycosyltransferase family 4 protein [Puia sp.]|nr:glycosyltransferase family 4 protein [Puia sp.]
MKLAIIVSHPIQYNTPLFRLLTERDIIEIMVFYTWGEAVLENKYDPGFGKVIHWDIPLLEGYPSQFLKNTSTEPGSHHFNGIINPDSIQRIDEWQPDALLIYGWNFRSHLKLMRYYKGRIPVYFRGDSTLLDQQAGMKSLIRRIILKWVYRHVDKVFYVGENNRNYFKEAGLKESGLILAPHVVDNEFFQANAGYYEQEAQRWRLSLGIGEDSIVFLFAGKLEKKKSPFLLLNAFNACSFPSGIHLIFVGNGEMEESLKSAAKIPNVHFIEFQNQKKMPVVYRLADVVVLPSGGPGETWGLAINEAMASGRPVIASTKCGGAVDLIRPGVNGYIFKSGSESDLQEKMQALSKGKGGIKEMGRQAMLYIRQFSLSGVAREIERTVTGASVNR